MSVRARTYRGKFMYGNVVAPKIICQPLTVFELFHKLHLQIYASQFMTLIIITLSF